MCDFPLGDLSFEHLTARLPHSSQAAPVLKTELRQKVKNPSDFQQQCLNVMANWSCIREQIAHCSSHTNFGSFMRLWETPKEHFVKWPVVPP